MTHLDKGIVSKMNNPEIGYILLPGGQTRLFITLAFFNYPSTPQSTLVDHPSTNCGPGRQDWDISIYRATDRCSVVTTDRDVHYPNLKACQCDTDTPMGCASSLRQRPPRWSCVESQAAKSSVTLVQGVQLPELRRKKMAAFSVCDHSEPPALIGVSPIETKRGKRVAISTLKFSKNTLQVRWMASPISSGTKSLCIRVRTS